MRRWSQMLRLSAVFAGLAMAASGCFGGTEDMIVLATFDDVADLTTNASVKVADVKVGVVDSIDLSDDMRATVTMTVDPTIDLPGRLQARLRKTSVLGERFIDIVPMEGGGSWVSGTQIPDEDAVIIPELEEVIQTSTDLLIAVSTDTLAGAIRSGAAGLDGRGTTIGTIIDDLNLVTSTYNANSADLVRLLEGLDQFLDTVGPQAELHGRALRETREFVRVLAEEDDNLIDTLVNLRDLSRTGTDIMVTHRQRIDDFVFRLDEITESLTQPEVLTAFDTLFISTAIHNFGTIRGVNNEHVQVILDMMACGVNDLPGDPVRSCDAPPQGQPIPVLRPPQDYTSPRVGSTR